MTDLNLDWIQFRQYLERDELQLKRLVFNSNVLEKKNFPVPRETREREWQTLDKLMWELREGRHGCVVAHSKNRLAGFSMFHLYNNQADDYRKEGVFELLQFYIKPKYRGHGLGTGIVKESLDKMKQVKEIKIRPSYRVISEIADDNEASKRIHTNLRFKPLAPKPGSERPGYWVYGRRI